MWQLERQLIKRWKVGQKLYLKQNISYVKKKQVMVRFKPRIFAATGIFETSRLSWPGTHRKLNLQASPFPTFHRFAKSELLFWSSCWINKTRDNFKFNQVVNLFGKTYFKDRIGSRKICVFQSKRFQLWNLEYFKLFLTASRFVKIYGFSKQAIQAMKVENIWNYF